MINNSSYFIDYFQLPCSECRTSHLCLALVLASRAFDQISRESGASDKKQGLSL